MTAEQTSIAVGGGGSDVTGAGARASIICSSACCAMPGWLASISASPSAVDARRLLNRTLFTSCLPRLGRGWAPMLSCVIAIYPTEFKTIRSSCPCGEESLTVTILHGYKRLIPSANSTRHRRHKVAQISVYKIGGRSEFTRPSGDIFVSGARFARNWQDRVRLHGFVAPAPTKVRF